MKTARHSKLDVLQSVVIATILLALSPALAAGDSVTAGALVIEKPWSRASIGTERPAAAYMTIRNTGSAGDVLTGIETPIADMSEVHKSEMQNGVMSMAQGGSLMIPAGGTVKLAPGGLHVMLMHLRKQLNKGEKFPLTLVFEKAGRIDLTVPILGMGATGPKE